MNSQTAINAALRTKLNSPPTLISTTHRFVPGEKPRSVSTDNSKQPNLASEVSFSPVTTLSVGNGQTYVRPVRNTQPRAISPTAVSTEGQVSIRGERVIDLAGNLHEQIKTKVNQGVSYQKETLIAPTQATSDAPSVHPPVAQPSVRPPTVTPEQDKARSLAMKQQLEEINKVLFEQIRAKIAMEISTQKGQPNQLASTAAKPAAFKQPKLASSQAATLPSPTAPSTPKTPSPQAPVAKPPMVATVVHNQPQSIPTTPPSLAKASVATVTKPVASKTLPPAPSKSEANLHIENLEREIQALSKEIGHIDQTLTSLNQERNLAELSALEQKLVTDEKMLTAVQDWRYTLTNLVNSHTLGLKYLKQKTDWLEDKVESLEGHHDKHEKLHRKPREISFKLEKVEPKSLEKPTLPTVKTNLPTPTPETKAQPQQVVKFSQTEATSSGSPAVIQSTLTQPAQIKEVIRKEEVRPEAVKAEVAKAVEQKQAELQPKVEDLVKEQLDRQPLPGTRVSASEVEKLVAEAIKKQLPTAPTAGAARPISPPLSPNANPSDQPVGATLEDPANITVGQPKVLPDNPEAQINIQAIPVSTSAKPIENLPTVATGAALSSQSDIERQILESATREEAAKEAVQKAKEEIEQKRKKDNAAAEKARLEAAQKAKASPAEVVTNESLKEDLTKLKSSLTTVDNKALETMSKEERASMIHQLNTLERESEISRQLDEIKGAAERRRVNTQLQTMLEKLGEKPAPNPTANQSQISTGAPVAKVETLKEAEKKERSPEEKARIIAEIKALEREREAKKIEERSRPVVKAQPAYGKMLPNSPTIPNVINGIVKDNKGLLMDTVVIIVKDQNGDPVRAFKTNKIGQFAVSTPLPNGVFTLELEKQGYEFDIIEVDVNGGILPPIEVKAR